MTRIPLQEFWSIYYRVKMREGWQVNWATGEMRPPRTPQ